MDYRCYICLSGTLEIHADSLENRGDNQTPKKKKSLTRHSRLTHNNQMLLNLAYHYPSMCNCSTTKEI